MALSRDEGRKEHSYRVVDLRRRPCHRNGTYCAPRYLVAGYGVSGPCFVLADLVFCTNVLGIAAVQGKPGGLCWPISFVADLITSDGPLSNLRRCLIATS